MNCNEIVMKNPNLYVELSPSGENGYLLQEDSRLILLEDGSELFY
jgi:hypothetical protein